jgi:glutaredoxin-like YruB-family protein
MIKVYSTKTCPWCTKAKDYLSSLKVDFESVDVSADRAAATRMVERTGQRGVPVIEFDEKTFIVGFDKPAIDEALRERKLLPQA